MANPQIENGHVKIANDLLEALMEYPFTGKELKVLFCLIRKSYGWNDKKARIALSEISEQTGINKSNLSRTINTLKDLRIIKFDNEGAGRGKSRTYQLNKDYDKWRLRTSNWDKTNPERLPYYRKIRVVTATTFRGSKRLSK